MSDQTPPSAASHTPAPATRLPWLLPRARSTVVISHPAPAADIRTVASCANEDDAAYIVAAVNAFPALLEALHAAIAGMATIQAVVPSFRKALDEPLTIARAALARAEQGA